MPTLIQIEKIIKIKPQAPHKNEVNIEQDNKYKNQGRVMSDNRKVQSLKHD